MKRLKLKLWLNALQWLQSKCDHNPNFVMADILTGEYFGIKELNHCQRCGAYRFLHYIPEQPKPNVFSWVRPMPRWTLPEVQKMIQETGK